MSSREVPSPGHPIPLKRLLLDLLDPDLRGHALFELCKKREMFPDLALLLWHSFGTISELLLEIITIYRALSPPSLTPAASNRVCNVLALFQCVASHPETRTPFLNAQLPCFVYPFLRIVDKTKPFEYLRLTSLGVIGALVEVEDTEVIKFLLQSEAIPPCLQAMEIGSELSKTVATSIVEKVLLDDAGLCYLCATAERFFATGHALAVVSVSLIEQPSLRLLKHIICCYLRLCDNPRARVALRICLPSMLRDGTFDDFLRGEPSTQQSLKQLLATLAAGSPVLDPAGTSMGA
uniref:Uncharacterized protein n=4 Tax=Avena sativa TaxID=4498 RepID=A0ACD5UXN8_AVESA